MCRNNNNIFIGISPFETNYRFDLTYVRVTFTKQCLIVVEPTLSNIEYAQTKLIESLHEVRETMKHQVEKGIYETPQ